jgi:hypothetical protein
MQQPHLSEFVIEASRVVEVEVTRLLAPYRSPRDLITSVLLKQAHAKASDPRKSGRRLPQSKSSAISWAFDRAPASWTAAVPCRFPQVLFCPLALKKFRQHALTSTSTTRLHSELNFRPEHLGAPHLMRVSASFRQRPPLLRKSLSRNHLISCVIAVLIGSWSFLGH